MRGWHNQRLEPTYLIVVVHRICALPLCSVFPLLDVEQHLARLFLLCARVDVLPAEASKHALENVPDLRLEVILVVVRPAKEGGNKIFQVRTQQVGWHRVDRELDEAKDGLDYLAIGGGEEDEKCGEDFRLHVA